MNIATDVRNYADLALEQGKTALTQATAVVTTANKRLVTDAPKPAYAALGAADLLAVAVTKRIEALPSDAIGSVSKAQEGGKSLLGKAQQDALNRVGELRGRLDAGIGAVKSIQTRPLVKLTAEVYVDNAKRLYGQLTARGEARAAELLTESRLAKVIGDVSDATGARVAKVTKVASAVSADVAPLAQSAFDTARNVAADVEPEVVVRSTPARKPARTSAASTGAKTAPAKRASAKSTLPKTTPAKSTLPKSTLPKSTLPKSTLPKSTLPKSTPAKSTTAKRASAKSTLPKTTPANSAPAKSAPVKSTNSKGTTRRTAKKAPAKASSTHQG